ncbi:hypothetical protein Q4Q49_22070 [Shewanella sp. SP1S1-7]|uniref:hypothetical protein n=1 Tax=Shewanella sp. SP1S1-7 TaxID=3063536 RepID=UPI00288E8FC9|nr:hypothetical protein [Shewanella sp. SP1S1-7]MDT3337947.1 hypothetical protein [Shewanella sp. SP1S1-7]
MNIVWNQIDKAFHDDGSLRDIYFFGTNVEIWNSFIASVLKSEFGYKFYKGGELCEIYTNFDSIFEERKNTSLMLVIEKNGVSFNCHFFTDEEIELDISPREVNNPLAFNTVLEFMSYFSKATNISSVLTYENSPEHEIIKCSIENGFVPIQVT